jgi:hypothetical protein
MFFPLTLTDMRWNFLKLASRSLNSNIVIFHPVMDRVGDTLFSFASQVNIVEEGRKNQGGDETVIRMGPTQT